MFTNSRAKNITGCLNKIYNHKKDHYNIIEVGTMFSEKEGWSTLVMAHFLKEHKLDGHIFTIDNNQQHLDSCKKMIKEYDEDLLKYVRFVAGYSTDVLPSLLNDNVTFAFIDGGAHPEVNLIEFEMIFNKLDNHGLILVDDLQEIKESPMYNLHRTLGKGQLILPYLATMNYINNFHKLPEQTQKQVREHSPFIKALQGTGFKVPDYKLSENKRMLICGYHIN